MADIHGKHDPLPTHPHPPQKNPPIFSISPDVSGLIQEGLQCVKWAQAQSVLLTFKIESDWQKILLWYMAFGFNEI